MVGYCFTRVCLNRVYLDEFEFSLFSSATKIVRIEDAPTEGPDFAQAAPVALLGVSNKRPDSYYFVNDKHLRDEARIQRIQSCAISGEDIIAQSTIPWPGMQMPWRVIHIPSPTTTTKRKKSSKKRRLILKQRTERRQSGAVKTTPFKNNDMRNWRFYNIKTRPKPKFEKRSGKVKEKHQKPHKIAL
ncbi:uncharacterized protein V1513DRAFT_459017 [Lipomyces chichibuensis]|uniref:uncharacterized protein n=1 Tax=Lipomyces chichibuensis TaxID=1546026 RepID=UPI003343FDF4